MLKRSPGGLDSLSDKERERVENARDPQLERAYDVLKGLALYSQLNPAPAPSPKPEKMAAK